LICNGVCQNAKSWALLFPFDRSLRLLDSIVIQSGRMRDAKEKKMMMATWCLLVVARLTLFFFFFFFLKDTSSYCVLTHTQYYPDTTTRSYSVHFSRPAA
jgi:hypothetical protein